MSYHTLVLCLKIIVGIAIFKPVSNITCVHDFIYFLKHVFKFGANLHLHANFFICIYHRGKEAFLTLCIIYDIIAIEHYMNM